MKQKSPPEVLSQYDLKFMESLNERDRRHFLATKAAKLKSQGFSYRKVSKKMGTSTHTIRKSLKELHSGTDFPNGRIRRAGGGRKPFLSANPELIQVVAHIIEPPDFVNASPLLMLHPSP